MTQKQNSYFLTDKDLDEIAIKIVNDLYSNTNILELKNNGRVLSGNLGILISRQISGLYSNIDGHMSLQALLTNSLRYAVLTDKNTACDTEFKKIREACERRKNVLIVLNRRLESDSENEIIKTEIEKTREELSLLESQLNEIASKNMEQPQVKKNILEIARKAYGVLLRNDKTSEKLYVAICNHLNLKIPKEHFGYDVYKNQDDYKPNYMRNTEQREDIYVPPALRYYGRRTR